MKLLFTDNTGNEELKELLGFLDLNLKFANIKSFLYRSTAEIIELIGQEVYDIAIAEYAKATDDVTKNTNIIFNIRYAAALQAYRKYAPHNDLSHTNNGRINRVEDKEKTPFEWMIDADNKALERGYYEALDGLIKYLDSYIAAWKGTAAYKQINNLFIKTAKDFEDYFPIGNSRLLLLKLAPGIRLAESHYIKPYIGKILFDAMKTELQNPQSPPVTNINQELLEKIKEVCVWKALSWAMRRLSVQLFPEGIVQNIVSDRKSINAKLAAPKNEVIMAAHYFDEDAAVALSDLQLIISKINTPLLPIPEPLVPYANADDKFLNT